MEKLREYYLHREEYRSYIHLRTRPLVNRCRPFLGASVIVLSIIVVFGAFALLASYDFPTGLFFSPLVHECKVFQFNPANSTIEVAPCNSTETLK